MGHEQLRDMVHRATAATRAAAGPARNGASEANTGMRWFALRSLSHWLAFPGRVAGRVAQDSKRLGYGLPNVAPWISFRDGADL